MVTHAKEQAARCCAPQEGFSTEADALKYVVRDKYAEIALGNSCCANGYTMMGDAYDNVAGYVQEADLNLGCGIPTEHASLVPGQTVLDLGAGAGLDAFIARRLVGEKGRVLGLDFTPAMVEKARANAQSLRYDNVEFFLGDIEHMPFPDAYVDVILSNCVLNLVPDKRAAFSQIFRVLRSGGYFAISDIVSVGMIPESERSSVASYVGCVAGAMERSAYLDIIKDAGFVGLDVVRSRSIHIPNEDAKVLSITVRASKP